MNPVDSEEIPLAMKSILREQTNVILTLKPSNLMLLNITVTAFYYIT